MRNWMQGLILALILVLALALRWTGLDWDGYHHYHPDERYITWVATTIEWPGDWRTALDPSQSSFNPFYWAPGAASEGIEVLQDQPRDFAYGHLPLYLGVIATRLAERAGPILIPYLPPEWALATEVLNGRQAIEFNHLTAVSRALTGLVDSGSILVLFLLGRRVAGAAAGLLAAAFLAVNVMHIQLAHFFTADPYLAFFALATIYFLVRYAGADRVSSSPDEGYLEFREHETLRALAASGTPNLLLAAAFSGLAIGSKFSAVLLFLPLVLAIWLVGSRHWIAHAVAALLTSFLVFFISNPFAVLDMSCEVLTPARQLGPLAIPALDWRSCYLQNVMTQSAMVRGEIDLAFTRQYAGTLPYLYPMEMQLRWGMGWALGLLAFAGFFGIVARAIAVLGRRFRQGIPLAPDDPAGPSSLVLLAWTVPFFLLTGSFFVKFMRYMLPLTPFLMLYGAMLLWQWRSRRGRFVLATLVLLLAGLYALSFVAIYQVDHPWDTASRWVYAHVPPGTLLASEQWDDSLPATMIVDGEVRRRNEYRNVQLTWLTDPDAGDDEEKLMANLRNLARAEYVTVLTNRVYGVVPRLPERYPLSSQYYQLLFSGDLGFEPVFVAGRMPHLGGITLQPEPFSWPGLQPPDLVQDYLARQTVWRGGRFDESFTVYDQPLVMIFRNVERQTAAEMRERFVPE